VRDFYCNSWLIPKKKEEEEEERVGEGRERRERMRDNAKK
jgi:hypothetical protein